LCFDELLFDFHLSSFSDSGASLSDEPGDYTIVGVSSMHRPTSREERQAATRPLLRVDPMDEGDEEEGEEEVSGQS
jgi:hypothetical protein